MSTPFPAAAAPRRNRTNLRLLAAGAAGAALVLAMALSTKVVRTGEGGDAVPGAFSAPAYGQSEFPKVRKAVEERATPAPALADAIAKDPDAAAKQHGVAASAGPEYAVSFTGVVGDGDSGNVDVAVDGLPAGVRVAMQTGPAIMGTDLRDGTGTIQFGQFTNQIDYQNAGSALNREMKKQVLSKVDAANLKGKTVSVVGVFQLTDPAHWLVTPVALEVK